MLEVNTILVNTLNLYLSLHCQIYNKLSNKVTTKLQIFCFCGYFNTYYKYVRIQHVELNVSLLCASLRY